MPRRSVKELEDSMEKLEYRITQLEDCNKTKLKALRGKGMLNSLTAGSAVEDFQAFQNYKNEISIRRNVVNPRARYYQMLKNMKLPVFRLENLQN